MFRVFLFLLAVGLAVYALVDLSGSDERQRGGVPKGLWGVLIVVLPFLGPVAWIAVSRASRRDDGTGGSGGTRRPTGPSRRPSGPVAPDDDPDFLWRLDQEQRRKARDSGDDAASGKNDGDTPR